MLSREGVGGSGSGSSEPASSPPRVSPPKVIVDDSPLQPLIGKHKESLKVKLMMRRPINQLVAQGIMPPLKTPPAYFEQCKQLERAKTGDLLKAKIQRRPDRQELERRHILEQESHVDPSLAEKQRMLKKARLADQLNDQLSHRPGPLELIKKNILHTEEDIETAVKSGTLAFKATCEGSSGRPQHPSSYCGPPDEVSPTPSPPSPPSTLSPASVASPPQHPAPGKDKNRKKSKQKQQPKARFKFHEYKGPPNVQQKAATPPGETPYELLLQQQQLLLQLMVPASPAPSSAASDCSETYVVPPPPPPPPTAVTVAVHTRYEDMKVSDLRAECKRLNLPVSGTKQQLLDRLRPYAPDKPEEMPRSPVCVASPCEPEPAEDIVQSQRRQITELERKLEASRRQLEAVRREAAGAAASDQSRRLLQAHLCVMQLRSQLEALQQPAPRIVLDAAPERLVRLYTAPAGDPAYILNGMKVVPIAILPSAPAPPPAPAPAPVPPPPTSPPRQHNEDSQIMDDVLEILVENGELPASAVSDPNNSQSIDAGYLTSSTTTFSPVEAMSEDMNDTRVHDSLGGDALQRELNDIQNKILREVDLHSVNNNLCPSDGLSIDNDLNVDLLSGDFSTDFVNVNGNADHDNFFGSLLSGAGPERTDDDGGAHTAMDITDDISERMSMTPLTNGDLLEHPHTGFDDMDDLSLPSFHNEETRPELDLKEFGIESLPGVEFEYMDAELIPNMFGRGHVPQCDPLLGAVLARPAPRPALKHYSWDKIEFDGT